MKWIGIVLSSLFWALFLGIFVVSMGLGAVFPTINNVAGPFVCAGGSLQEKSKNYHPHPGEKVTTVTWYCADEIEGNQKDVNNWTITLIAGTIYGLIIFIPVFLFFALRQIRKASKGQT
jgi:hypothetical protein